jgi:Rrf2 family transcriptional regulator, nitric oxide-sensitive transcriptional repressor
MLLTRQAQIAVAILVACARGGDRYVQTHEAAAESGASREHASKVAHLLRNAGFVTATRGRSGGIKLARAASAITLGAVLRHMQPSLTQRSPQHAGDLAMLDTVVETGWMSFVLLMDRFTIADLLAGRSPHRPPCHDCRLLGTHAASPEAFSTIQ